MKKISSGTILALLIASALLIAIPVAVVHGSTGTPTLGEVTSRTAGVTFRPFTGAPSPVSVNAGTDSATLPNGTAGFFAISFTGVTFSGSQFYLYLSKDGFSSIDSGDVRYAGIFNVADLSSAYHQVQTGSASNNGSFYAGLVDGLKVLEGPIPVKISSDYKFIKVFDGSTTAVAVSLQTLQILPGIQVSPSTGSAGIAVTVSGGGFASTASIAINYTYSVTSWGGTVKLHNGTWISSGITNNGGWFSHSATMLDTMQIENPPVGAIPTTTITFTAVNATKLSQHFTSGSGDATFVSSNRVIDQAFSYFSGATTDFANTGPYGNSSSVLTPVGSGNVLPILNAHVTGSLGIEGNYTNAGSTVTVTIGATTSTVSSDLISGHYIINVTIPTLPLGDNTVRVTDNGVTYEFTINVLPTLILTPSSGPIGTVVSLTAYGFPANNQIWIYWQCNAWQTGCNVVSGGTAYNVVNATTSSAGVFTGTVMFTIGHTYGGPHSVYAVANSTVSFPGASLAASTVNTDATGIATFTVTPTLVICNGSTCGAGDVNSDTVTISSNTRTLLTAVGSGFTYTTIGSGCGTPGAGSYNTQWYQVNIDNAMYQGPYISQFVNGTGDWALSFTAAGFRPGLHQLEVTNTECPIEAPQAIAYFNVTTTGDAVVNSVGAQVTSAVNAALAGFSTQLTSIQSSLTSIQSSLTTVTSDVSGLGTQLTAIQSSLTAITSDVSGLSGQLTSLSSGLSALSSVPATLTSIQGTLNTAATNAQNAATSAQSAATAANNAVSGNSTSQTYVLVVAVLAAITLVLELAILVRKLS